MYKLMNWPAIEAVVYAESDNPSSVLGPHASGNSTLYQVYVPGASEVRLQVPDEDKAIKMESVDEAGFFALLKSGKAPADYSYIAEFPDGKITRIEEAYRYDHKLPAKFIKDYMQGKAVDNNCNKKKDKFLLLDPYHLSKRSTNAYGDWISMSDLEDGNLMGYEFYYYKAERPEK